MDREAWEERFGEILFEMKYEDMERKALKYKRARMVTLSAFTEAGRTKSSISVPKQQSYRGTKPVISSSLANIPCTNLGVAGLLEMLNIVLGKSYTLQIPSLSSVLEACITQEYDFGTAYGQLRPVLWKCDNSINVEDELCMRKEWDREMRESVLVNNRILDEDVPPRRIWDLYSNRVVPWWTAKRWPWGISHAWMDEKDRIDVETPINRGEWPVPIPRDANLDLIRIEMLNHGAEYAWLDVLCLRQKGGQREDLRREEWQLDVPTIGSAYNNKHPVVYYFGGLGRPLHVGACDFDSPRSWFKRVWTLQEIVERMITGGYTGDKAMKKEIQAQFDKEPLLLEKIAPRQELVVGVFNALSLLQHRESTTEVDKVAVMVYLLGGYFSEIPAYYEMQSIEYAWSALVDIRLSAWDRGALLFLYPRPGDGNKVWRPSWSQVMKELPSHRHAVALLDRTKGIGAGWYKGRCIESGCVSGFAAASPERRRRQGELIVQDAAREAHTFKIFASHQCKIPDGLYVLLGSEVRHNTNDEFEGQFWVVGRRRSDQRFEKVSVFDMPDLLEVERLDKLGVTNMDKTFLT